MTTAERLRELRELKNWSQNYVAEQIGVQAQTIYKYENGTITDIPASKLEALARLYSVSPNYILGWDEVENSPLKEVVFSSLKSFSDDEVRKVLKILELINNEN